MAEPNIIVYGAEWCWDCRRTRKFLDQNNISYQWINIDLDRAAEQIVIRLNHGNRSVPTIVFPDGSLLVEPSNTKLAEKLALVGQ